MKRIKEFFGSLFPKKKRTSRKKSGRNLSTKKIDKNLLGFSFLKSKQAKIGIGIGAVALLLVTVLWGTPEMDNLLRFFGIRAADPAISLIVTPQEKDAYPEAGSPDNTAVYDIQLIPSGDYIEMELRLSTMPELTDNSFVSSSVFDSPDFGIGMPLIVHLENNDHTTYNLTLTVTTGPLIPPAPVSIDFFITIDGYALIDDGGPEPAPFYFVEMSPPLRLNIIPGALPAKPDFSLTIGDPRIVEVDAGQIATYQINVASIDGFEGLIDLYSDELVQYWLTDGYLTGVNVSENPVDFTGLPNQSKPIVLTLYTDNDPLYPYPLTLPFTIIGSSTSLPGETREDDGVLIINKPPPAPDFTISIVHEDAIHDDINRIVVVPENSLDFKVTVDRLNGWAGTVTADTDLFTGWPLDIDSAIFANNGIFNGGTENESTTLTVTIKDTCVVTDDSDINFTVTGYGDIDGDTIDEVRTDSIEFSIVDLTVTILDTPQTVAAGTDAVYEIDIQTFNDFNDDGSMRIVEDLIGNYGEHIEGFGFNLDISAERMTGDLSIKEIYLTIYTKESSPGIEGISFHAEVQGIDTGLISTSNEGILNIVTDPFFTLGVTEIRTITAGYNAVYTVDINRQNNFDEDVTIGVGTLVTGNEEITSALFGDLTTGTETYTFVDGGVNSIDLHIQTQDIDGDDSLHRETITFVLTCNSTEPPAEDMLVSTLNVEDFTIRVDADISSVTVGGTAIYTVILNTTANFNEGVNLSTTIVADLPQITSASFDFDTLHNNGDETTLRILTNAELKETPFTVVGTAQTSSETRDGGNTITITLEPSFWLSVEPMTRTITLGGTNGTTYEVTIHRVNGFNEDVMLSTNLKTLNSDVLLADFNMLTGGSSDTTTLIVEIDPESSESTTLFAVTGDAPSMSYTVNSIELIIQTETPSTPPGGPITPTTNDFSILIEPNERTVLAGDSTSYTVTATRNGYNGPISLTTDLLTNPEVASAIFEDQTLEAGMNETTLNVYTNSDANSGEITFTVSGNGAPGTRSDTAILNIRKEDEEIIPEELPSTGMPDWFWIIIAIIVIATLADLKLHHKEEE